MATENYIECEDTGDYKTYIDPVVSYDEVYTKELNEIALASDPEDNEDPQTGLADFRQILEHITITFIITEDSNNPDTVSERKTKLRNMYGFAKEQNNTRVTLHYDGKNFDGSMKRCSFTRNGGEPFYTCIIEVTLGGGYDEL